MPSICKRMSKRKANVLIVLLIQGQLQSWKIPPQWFNFILTKRSLLVDCVVPLKRAPRSVKFVRKRGIIRVEAN